MIARVWNAAGRACWWLGLALCAASGYCDARADEAGYWNGREHPPFAP